MKKIVSFSFLFFIFFSNFNCLISEPLDDLNTKELSECNLSYEDLKERNFEGKNLKKTNLAKCNLSNVCFKRCCLCQANLKCANLYKANFEEANLKKADLSSNQADFQILFHDIAYSIEDLIKGLFTTFRSGRDVFKKKFAKTEDLRFLTALKDDFILIIKFWQESVWGTACKILDPISLRIDNGNRMFANFDNAKAEEANFSYTFLNGTSFKNADLKNANFENCFLVGANFEDANLEGTNFENAIVVNANFSNATGLTIGQKDYLKDKEAQF
ncbi:hypothetical protein GF322_03915 [Candidatus Dependentiae bacterium]|nr:hypothetical protein [Candidatus Dependentiae bacterium]